MLRSKPLLKFTAFAVLVSASPVLACGPFFPATVINSAEALLAAPFVRFADSVARIPQPPATFRAVPCLKNESPEAQSLRLELADLGAAGAPPEAIARHRARRETLAEIDRTPALDMSVPRSLHRTDGLPPEFALYHKARVCLLECDPEIAEEHLLRLLALPSAERRFKSTWAAYQLGRLDQERSPSRARLFFQQTRELARNGFPDPLGLAAASLGWEAKTYYDAKDFAPAARLYLEQFATGDRTAVGSLRFLAERLLSPEGDGQLEAFAADPRLREIPTALLLLAREGRHESDVAEGATARWFAALERAGVTDAPYAARLALAAYRAGRFPACARWLTLAAPDDDLALWLRAKLALREGRIADASDLLSRAVRHSARADSPVASFVVFEDCDFDPAPAIAHLRAELAMLKLTTRDYTEALTLLLESRYWEDAAYVAERVLTVDELKTFVSTFAPPTPVAPAPPPAAPDHDEPRVERTLDLRALLARRLVRHNRLDEARPFFPATFTPSFDRFVTLLRAGRDSAQPATLRATSLMEAARVLRHEGMELRGTELSPDFAIWDGSYEGGNMLAVRAQLPAHLAPTQDEFWRASAQDTGRGQRYHYRYCAADLAWEAIALMPDETDATARALIEAGGWLKRRDAPAANRFYQALVKRCGTTPLGRAAAAQHWFPRNQ
jgi:hypothetical protein